MIDIVYLVCNYIENVIVKIITKCRWNSQHWEGCWFKVQDQSLLTAENLWAR